VLPVARGPPVLASEPGDPIGGVMALRPALSRRAPSEPGEALGGLAMMPCEGLAPGVAVVTVASPGAPEPEAGGAEVAPAEGRPPVAGGEIPPSPPPEAGGGELAAGEGLPAAEGDEIPPGADETPPEEPPPDEDELEPTWLMAAVESNVPAKSARARELNRMAGIRKLSLRLNVRRPPRLQPRLPPRRVAKLSG
jgi:hypothetical protein